MQLLATLCLLVFEFSRVLAAQTADPHTAQPERPSVATHAHTVATGWLEIEAGAQRDSRSAELPITAKLGVARQLQLSVSTAIDRSAIGDVSIGDVGLALKWRVADDVPLVGSIAVLPSISIPAYATDSAGVGVVAISSTEIGPVGLDLNVGYARRTADTADVPQTQTMWAAAAGGPLRGRVGWVSEIFGYPKTSGLAGRPSIVGTLLGATFALRRWLTFDAGVVAPLTGPQPRVVFLGAVWNAGRIWLPR